MAAAFLPLLHPMEERAGETIRPTRSRIEPPDWIPGSAGIPAGVSAGSLLAGTDAGAPSFTERSHSLLPVHGQRHCGVFQLWRRFARRPSSPRPSPPSAGGEGEFQPEFGNDCEVPRLPRSAAMNQFKQPSCTICMARHKLYLCQQIILGFLYFRTQHLLLITHRLSTKPRHACARPRSGRLTYAPVQ